MEGSDSDQQHEVVENCLNALESFALKCSVQMASHLDELNQLLLQVAPVGSPSLR